MERLCRKLYRIVARLMLQSGLYFLATAHSPAGTIPTLLNGLSGVPPQMRRPRILSVDDHDDTLLLLEVMLGARGCSVTSASSVVEGLKLAKDKDFDLYLLDFKFPDGTGKELCERIREFDRYTPILFFSGSHPALQQEALSCGAQGYVMKPDFDALRREINQALKVAV